MDGALPWLPTASYLEASWTLLSLFGLLIGLHRLSVRVRQWRQTMQPRAPALERIVAQTNLRHKALVVAVLGIGTRLGLLALVTPAGVSLGPSGGLSLLVAFGLLVADLLLDEVDAARIRRARDRETARDGGERRRRRG